MATVAAFNGMLGEFLSQMRRTGEKLKVKDPGPLKLAQQALQQCQDSDNPKKQRYVMEKFAKYSIPQRALIQARNADGTFDEKTFKQFLETAKKAPLLEAIGLHKFWDELPDASKQGIWQFMNQLLAMAIAIKSIPEGMLGQIESMAQSLVTQQMAGNEQQMPNPADLAQMLGSMASMGSGPPNISGDGVPPGLGSLLGALGGPK